LLIHKVGKGSCFIGQAETCVKKYPFAAFFRRE
jgi:hypothetical protein